MSATLGAPRSATTDPVALTRSLYQRFGERVFSFCMSRLRNPEEAQDAAQTTFVYVLNALRRGAVPRHELAWLLTIAENVCRSTRRSTSRRLAHSSNADVTELEAAAHSMTPETAEQLEEIRDALAHLPETQRRAILLREWQGLSYADIADQLGLTRSAVETLLFRARRGIFSYLKRSRGRVRALDGASALALLRSLLEGTATKAVAVGAGVAVAIAPAARPQLATATTKPPTVSVGAARAASPAEPLRPRSQALTTSARRAPAVTPRPAPLRTAVPARRAPTASARPARGAVEGSAAEPEPASSATTAPPAALQPVASLAPELPPETAPLAETLREPLEPVSSIVAGR